MADKNAKAANQTLTDDQILTERKLPRRSFLAATGALLVGAAAVASGVRAMAQDTDPDAKKATDPDKADKEKGGDADKKKMKMKKKAKKMKKESDPDKKKMEKASDPDTKPPR